MLVLCSLMTVYASLCPGRRNFITSTHNMMNRTIRRYLQVVNPLDSKGNYSATSNNTKLVHWSLMGGLLHLVQR